MKKLASILIGLIISVSVFGVTPNVTGLTESNSITTVNNSNLNYIITFDELCNGVNISNNQYSNGICTFSVTYFDYKNNILKDTIKIVNIGNNIVLDINSITKIEISYTTSGTEAILTSLNNTPTSIPQFTAADTLNAYNNGVASVSCTYTEQDTIDAYNNGILNGTISVDINDGTVSLTDTELKGFGVAIDGSDNLNISGYSTGVEYIKIYNISGTLAKENSVSSTIAVGDLTSGVYIAVVKVDGEYISYKFVR